MRISLKYQGMDVGIPIDLPQKEEKLQELCDKLQIENTAKTVVTIEAIPFRSKLNELLAETEVNLTELNYFAGEYENMDANEKDLVDAVLETRERFEMAEAINLLYNLDEIYLFTDFNDTNSIGKDLYYLYEGSYDYPENFDGSAYFKDMVEEKKPVFSSFGLIFENTENFQVFYDGKHLPEVFEKGQMSVMLAKGVNVEYVPFPTQETAVAKALERLDCSSLEECKVHIHSFADQVKLKEFFQDTKDFQTLNEISSAFVHVDPRQRARISEMMVVCEISEKEEAMTLLKDFNNLEFDMDVLTEEQYGKKLLKENNVVLSGDTGDYFDFESYGRDKLAEIPSMLTELGLVSYQGKNQETHDLLHEKLGFPVYVPPKLEEMKFYMPLTVETCYEENGYGGYEQQSEMFEISPYVLLGCEDLLNEKLMDYADRKELGTSFQERGLMAFYMDNDSIAHKVEEFNFSFEEIEGEMYGVAVCQVDGKLSSEELTDLKNFITGQASDGLGEGFEQQDIKVGEIEVSVSLWNSNDWELKTAEEMGFQEQELTGYGEIQ